MAGLRYSITTGAAGALGDPRSLADLGVLAEDSGWDGLFLEDYLVYQGRRELPTYDPWIALAAVAMATTTIRIGLTVTPLPRRRPWVVAAQATTLDHLSDGRFTLGVGLGDRDGPDFAATPDGAEPRTLARRLDEGLTILDTLWSGKAVRLDQAYDQDQTLELAARPVQRPRIPVWVGGDLTVPGVRRRIARWDGACAYRRDGPLTPDDVRDLVATAGGRTPFDVKVSGSREPADLAAWEAAGATWWGQWVDPAQPDTLRATIAAGPPRHP